MAGGTKKIMGMYVIMMTLMVMVHNTAALRLIPGPETTPKTTPRPKHPASYRVTFSTRIRPGMTLPVTVHLVSAAHSATVTVSLVNNSRYDDVFARAPSTFVTGGVDNTIYLEIPTDIKQPHWRYWSRYAVQVVATGDVSFNQSEVVTLSEKAFSIFVQTDKAVYKPGQTVKFRALAMEPDLTVMQELMDIKIRDPQGNLIKQWRKVAGVNNTGVVEKSLPTSTEPPLGYWEIEVTVRGYSETKKFQIDKYVLPKYEAKLDVPKAVVTSEPGLKGKAFAKYTFGKPLTGAQVTVTVKCRYFWSRYGNVTQPTRVLTGTLDEQGEFAFFFPKTELKNLKRENNDAQWKRRGDQTVSLDWQRFVVIANVTDSRTGHKMGAVSHVQFFKEAAKVEILPLTSTTFKPGLRYTAYVSVTQQDKTLFPNYQSIVVTLNVTKWVPWAPIPPKTTTTTTTAVSSASGKGNLSKVPIIHPGFYVPRPPEREVVVLVLTKPLTANGFLAFDFDVPANTSRISMTATALGVKRSRSASKAESPSGNYVQITGQPNSPQVGQTAKLSVKTTEPVESLIYQVYTKGLLVLESQAVVTDSEGQKFSVSFPVTANMAPNTKVLVFYLRSDGEVVADSLSFKVDMSSADQVEVSYDRQKVKPGEEVEMRVRGRPNSVVFLLSVDKSVKLLKAGNDITQDLVNQELVRYDYGGYFGFWRYMSFCGWPYPSQGADAYSIFREANVAMLTDGYLYRKPREYYYRMGAYGARFAAASSPSKAASRGSVSAVERVRTYFPETWLWNIVLIGSDGQYVMKSTAPDTITTWLTSAFAVHPQYGLSVLSEPAQLTTFRDIFVSLDLPYSAIRGEQLCMKAFAFNYYNRSLDMMLTMGRTHGILNIEVTPRQSNFQPIRQILRSYEPSHRIGMVQPNGVKETAFCFIPRALGRLPIRVNLITSGVPGDGVERMLLVEPEGLRRTTSVAVTLDVRNGKVFEHTVPLIFPNRVVPGSQSVTISVAGDLLGPVFENLDDLLRMPYGCGEQNMLYFAPNVFLIDYLQNTQTYTPERAKKAENYMLIGYQKEIQYQHNDGSYSAFGNRHKNETGSMWLTAFVTKCFVQSMSLDGEVVTIDPTIVSKGITWMVQQQTKQGAFPEPGTVFNQNMQGGSAKGEALTAYVLIALAEAQMKFEQLNSKNKTALQQAIVRGRTYLEQQLTSLTDSYDIAIVTYALHITNSSLADQAFDLLKSKGISESLTLHWERPQPRSSRRYYWLRQTDAINIEMTSYALLTFIYRNDVSGGLPIVRWLTSQRGPQGGFISTQDTVIGLQALAEVATKIYQPTFTPITVNVQWTVNRSQHYRNVTLNNQNRLMLHQVHVPIENEVIPSNILITASTQQPASVRAIALAQVTLTYNVYKKTRFRTFRLQPSVIPLDRKGKRFVLTVETSRIDGKMGGMTVMTVGLLTGYTLNQDSDLYNVTGTSMTELKDDSFILYFKKMDNNPVKVTLPMEVAKGNPLKTKPASIHIYDYYENGGQQQQTTTYNLTPGATSICANQPGYEGCTPTALLYF